MIDMLGAWIIELFIYMFKLIRATHYPTSVKTKEIYRSDGMNNCLIDICNIWLFSLGWCGLYWRSTVCISCINYQRLFSFFFNMEYLVFEFGVYDIWLLEIMLHCIALHCTTWHLELCREPKVATVPVQHRLLGITMQLHTLSGMKAGVHMYPYAYSIIGLA